MEIRESNKTYIENTGIEGTIFVTEDELKTPNLLELLNIKSDAIITRVISFIKETDAKNEKLGEITFKLICPNCLFKDYSKDLSNFKITLHQ